MECTNNSRNPFYILKEYMPKQKKKKVVKVHQALALAFSLVPRVITTQDHLNCKSLHELQLHQRPLLHIRDYAKVNKAFLSYSHKQPFYDCCE